MVNWTLIPDYIALETWDKNLSKFCDFNIYQSFNWGEYKRYFGWVPYRFAAYNAQNEVIAMAQCLYHHFPLGGIMWCPGGPLGDVSSFGKTLIIACVDAIKKRYLYFRFDSYSNSNEYYDLTLIKNGWQRPVYSINTDLTMILDLTRPEEELIRSFSKNWRHNLKRFKKDLLNIEPWVDIDIDEMLNIYRSMENFKSIQTQYSKEELLKLFEKFGDKILMYRCNDRKTGDLIAFRGAIIYNNKAWDFFAATNIHARKLYASHKLLWTLLRACKDKEVKLYDMGGVDPCNNPGVYNFKKGVGALKVRRLGEWEFVTPRILRYVVNLAIKYRCGIS